MNENLLLIQAENTIKRYSPPGPHSSPPLGAPCSHLVKEGDLMKVGIGGARRYKFVLFSDMLVYGTETIRAKLQKDHLEYKVL